MSYGSKSISDWVDDAFRISKQHGFHDKEPSFGEVCALIHSEVSEAFEDYRNGESLVEMFYLTDDGERTSLSARRVVNDVTERVETLLNKPCGIPSELGDIVIRVMDFCGAHGIDLERVIREKMIYNETRPHMHGGKKI